MLSIHLLSPDSVLFFAAEDYRATLFYEAVNDIGALKKIILRGFKHLRAVRAFILVALAADEGCDSHSRKHLGSYERIGITDSANDKAGVILSRLGKLTKEIAALRKGFNRALCVGIAIGLEACGSVLASDESRAVSAALNSYLAPEESVREYRSCNRKRAVRASAAL